MNIFDLIFPKKCLECNLPAQAGKEGQYICSDCLEKVPPAGWNREGVYSIWKYEGVIRKAIIALKYKYVAEIANELSELSVKKLSERHFSLSATLVPIPLYWYRKNFRGFNQSEEVGKLVAAKMGWKFIPDLLIKTKSTKSQVELKGFDRRKNLSGVFALNPVYGLHSTDYILFDDVLTTGSTLLEASKVLRKNGARKVLCLTITR